MSSKRYRRIYTFEWVGGRGSIATIPANNIKQAFARMMIQLRALHHDWVYDILQRAYDRRQLEKIIEFHRTTLPKSHPGLTWQKVKPPHS